VLDRIEISSHILTEKPLDQNFLQLIKRHWLLIAFPKVVLQILQELLSKQLHFIKKRPISVQLSLHGLCNRIIVALLQQTGQVGENLPPCQWQFSLLFTQIALVLAQVIFQAKSELSHANVVFVFVAAQLRR
jgi:hypothetical protein